MLSRVSERRLIEEREVNESLFELLDARDSFVFEAGAGSGKTHSLVECLRHIVRADGIALRARGQEVACITYTNVAADEVRSRLGASDVVAVSTIHDFLWPRMAPFQAELVATHREKLAAEMALIKKELAADKKFEAYTALSEDERGRFVKALAGNKGAFYDAYDLKAADFREVMQPLLAGLASSSVLLKNCGNFKALASRCLRMSDYANCIVRIDAQAKGYAHVEYDPRTSSDRLARMTFSHDTLLAYARCLAETSGIFRRMLLDSHPFVLVDECQDTSMDVVMLVECLREESRSLGRDFVVGYFGDPAQSIYETGIAGNLKGRTDDLAVVTKPHNRRSCREVIEAGNRIRGGDITQESIYEDDGGGTVELFAPVGHSPLSDEATRSFINRTAIELGATEQDPLHCLVLKKKRLAELVGFGNLFEQMGKASYFKKNLGFERLGEEFAATNPDKLNKACRLLYDLCELRRHLATDSTMLSDVGISFGPASAAIKIRVVRNAIETMRSIGAATPGEYLEGIGGIVNSKDDRELASCVRRMVTASVGKEALGRQSAITFLCGELYPHASACKAVDDAAELERLLSISFDEYDAWCSFVRGEGSGTVRYHTYHGTKGEEYGSVLIIGENDFRSRDGLFKTFFESHDTVIEDDGARTKVERARNLLYVATTRAIRSLRVLYIDDIAPLKKGIEYIYGPAHGVDESTAASTEIIE